MKGVKPITIMQSYKSKAFAVQEILDGGLVDSYIPGCVLTKLDFLFLVMILWNFMTSCVIEKKKIKLIDFFLSLLLPFSNKYKE